MSVLEARALRLLPLVRFAAPCLVCQTLLGDEVAAEEAELHWPAPIDLVPSVVLAVAGTALTGCGAEDSCIPPTGTDDRSDRCEVA